MIGTRRRRHRFAALVMLGALGSALASAAPAQGKPSVWDVARDPKLKRADDLFKLAERSRVSTEDGYEDGPSMLPSATSEELERQLNARAALVIITADGHELGDARLSYLLGDALAKAGESYLPEASTRLRQALALDPSSPLAGQAWFSLAITEGKLRHHDAERAAYTEALAYEWEPEDRAVILTNRAESTMSAGDLRLAMQDYRSALALGRSALARALALWGLSVALERDGDLPSALPLAREANRIRFGPPGRPMVALDVPTVYFTPDYEEYYYRALATMAEAIEETRPEAARRLFQTASLLWSLYVDNATPDAARWLPNAKLHRDRCRQELERLGSADDDAPQSSSKAGRNKH